MGHSRCAYGKVQRKQQLVDLAIQRNAHLLARPRVRHQRRQKCGVNSTSTDISSRRPSNMASEHTHS